MAVGVTESEASEVLGLDVGLTEDGPFWTAFLRGSVRRGGLTDVLLVMSDAHEGLKEAIRRVFGGSSWQRCRVHFMRNLLSQVPKSAQQMVAALVRTLFAQPDKPSAHAQLADVAEGLEQRFPKAAEMLRDTEEDILTYMAFPSEHWRQLHSTNPLERLMREIGRRTDVVGIFPNRSSPIRLAGAVRMEQQDEWTAARRRYFSQEYMNKLYGSEESFGTKESLVVPNRCL